MEVHNNKKHPCSHEENRSKICLFCCCKTKVMFKIDGELKKKLSDKLGSDEFMKNKYPSSLCATCRKKVYYSVKNKSKLEITLPNFSGEIIITRQNIRKICGCGLCELARTLKCKKKKYNR